MRFHHMGWGWGPGWWIIGGLLWLVFWIAVVVVVVTLVRGRAGAPQGGSMTPALRVLEDRYARGEISREEFLERRAVLTGTAPPPAPPPPPAEPAGGETTQQL